MTISNGLAVRLVNSRTAGAHDRRRFTLSPRAIALRDRASTCEMSTRRRACAPWRLVLATLLAAVLVMTSASPANAQQRYRVKPGDTLWSVADRFGVDPEAILRASWIQDPPNLQPGEVIIIPDPGQSPEEAALVAAEREGTSPWVTDAYYVQPGDTIEGIAATFSVAIEALITFNNLDDPDLLQIGQRILIPATPDDITGDTVVIPAYESGPALPYPSSPYFPWVPAYKQARSLSCEYASAFIATSAFGNGIPESVFWESIPQAQNPHLGYRGDIDGAWGGYDDYGIYPEPLVPVLNAYGFVGEVIYAEGDPSLLTAHLDAGHPVIVWLALWGDTGIVYNDEGTYTVFAGAHVVTAFAYDDGGVFVSDPGWGSYRYFTWDAFMYHWTIMDGMALAVFPAAELQSA